MATTESISDDSSDNMTTIKGDNELLVVPEEGDVTLRIGAASITFCPDHCEFNGHDTVQINDGSLASSDEKATITLTELPDEVANPLFALVR